MENMLGQIEFLTSDGKPTTLAAYAGKVLLIVNVASQCGLTPQYDGLGKMFKTYAERGLMVLAFPANEFGAQEPGSNAEIQEFCTSNFGVKFPVHAKIKVKCDGQHPLYTFLTSAQPKAIRKPDSALEKLLTQHGLLSGESDDIMWNFEKFVVSRTGKVVARFAPDVTPDDPALIAAIEAELAR